MYRLCGTVWRLYHLSARTGLGGLKVCVECERLPRESEKRARQWIEHVFKRRSPCATTAPLFDLDLEGGLVLVTSRDVIEVTLVRGGFKIFSTIFTGGGGRMVNLFFRMESMDLDGLEEIDDNDI